MNGIVVARRRRRRLRRRVWHPVLGITRILSYDYRDTLSFIRLFAYSLSSLQEKEVHSFTDFLLTTDEDMLAMVLRAALRDGVIMIGASEDDERKIGRRVNDGDVTSMIVLRSWMGHLC